METEERARHIANASIADIKRLEAKYSRYRNDSLISEINRVANNGGSITLDTETCHLLNYAVTCHEQSDGLFDITSGILRKAWHFDRQTLPDKQQLRHLRKKIGWRKLRWNEPVLTFPVKGMELDFGGIVKEYAVDRAAQLCRNAGANHGVINLGGDLKTIGPRTDNQSWRVGIKHPRNGNAMMQTLLLQQGAVASSGDYERCLIVNGQRYSHILNPKTGWPSRHLTAVSVVADFCVVAGSAATIAILKEQDGPAWLENLGLPHLWVDVNGNSGGSLTLR